MSRLKSLTLQEFKCFRHLDVELGSLTVLCGVNGGGKSTIIQSILLLSQAIRNSSGFYKTHENGWPLNGDLIRLESPGDVICRHASEKFLKLGYETLDYKHTFRLSISKNEPRCLENNDLNSDLVSKFSEISNLTYISANRGILSDFPMPEQPDYRNFGVGIDGRFASYWFNELDSKIIQESRCLVGLDEENYFQSELNAWLDTVIPGAKARVRVIDFNNKLALDFQLSGSSDYFKPVNVGYGIPYVFPILVALLAAETNDLIIIDSPEAHLHPSAQSKLGQMIALFASTGIQIVIETHSEHVLNGIRIGVLKEKINSDNVKLLFFSGNNEFGNGLVTPNLDRSAKINQWPNPNFT